MRCFKKILTLSWCVFFASLLGAATANAAEHTSPAWSKIAHGEVAVAAPAVTARNAAEGYGELPLSFEANQGQVGEQTIGAQRSGGPVQFLSRGSGYSFFLTQTGAVLSFSRDSNSSSVLRMRLLGADSSAHIEGENELPGRSNYFLGSDSTRWHTGIPTYSQVKYESIYPGISLVYYGNQHQLEYDFVVAPGADPRQIRLSIAGAEKIAVNAQGNLVLHNAAGEVQLLAPKVYQEILGQKKAVAGEWMLAANHVASFRIGKYDRTQPLVIDPVLQYSSFLGGSQKSGLNRIAIDAAGNAYVAGYTSSGDFPAAPTPQANSFGPGTPARGAFVAKIDPSGTSLLYSTYLSGSTDEEATGLAVDILGNVYLSGTTHSTDFPTRNALQAICPTHNPAGTCASAFLTKISPTGDSLLFSTYLGGSGGESARSLVVDSAGSAYIAGATSSVDFPVTSGAAQATAQVKCGGSCQQNAFVAKFAPSGESLAFATYVGGSAVDDAADLALDSSGNIYLTGKTTSPDFPLAAPYQKSCVLDTSNLAVCVDTAFVTKIKGDGSAFVYSTYLGGSLGSQASAIAVDSLGSAYVTGSTQSSDFPVLNAFQKSCGLDPISGKCSVDAFLTKFAPGGKSLAYSTYLGGAGNDRASAIAVDAAGNAHITGATESADFPTFAPAQPQLKGSSDAFVARFSVGGSALTFSTYHGGGAGESGNSIALDAKGNVYLAGETSSPDFPTYHPFQSSCAGACTSAFVTKMTLPPANTAPTITSAAATTFTVATAGTFTVTTTGTPTPAISNGAATLPNSVTFTDNGDGTATMAGTPAAGTGGNYPFTITASNGTPPDATQSFTLTVDEAPSITSANAATFTEGVAGTFTVVAKGFPKPTLSEAGALPTGVTFTAATGVLSGTPAAGTAAGSPYTITFKASNGVGTDFSQTFTLTVNAAPTLSVVKTATSTFTQGGTGTWSIVVSNATTGTTTTSGLTVTDTLATGYTLASSTGTNWSCTGTGTAAVSCTSTSTIAGGAAYPTLTLTVNIPASSPNSVSNTAKASGGGALASAQDTTSVPVGQVPTGLVATSGANQSVPVGNAFAVFTATVTDAANNPISGVPVTFTAPTSGASCAFPGPSNTSTASSNSSGIATSGVCTANATSGSYNVQASVTTAGVPKPNFAEKNTDFSLAFAPASADVAPGTAPSATLTATALSGYTPTSLTVTNCAVTATIPAGLTPVPTCTITSPITVGTAATVNFSVTGSPAGTYTIQSTVHDNSTVNVTHTATFTLHIVTIAVAPKPAAAMEVGQTRTFTGTVLGLPDTAVNWTVTCTGSCGSVSPTSTPNGSTPTTYSSPVTAAANLPTEQLPTVTVVGTADGDANFSDNSGAFAITDFAVIVPASTLVVTQATTGMSSASAFPINGYTPVTIPTATCGVTATTAFTGGPTCATGALNVGTSPTTTPISISTGSTSASAPVGLYTATVTGTDAVGVVHTASELFSVQCALTPGQTVPTLIPVQGATSVSYQVAIGVTETAGGSACPYGNYLGQSVVGGTKINDASISSGASPAATSIVSGQQNGTLAATGTSNPLTFGIATPSSSGGQSQLTVPYFDATQTGNQATPTMAIGLEPEPAAQIASDGSTITIPVTEAAAGTLNVATMTVGGACVAVNLQGQLDPANNNFGITCTAAVNGNNIQLTLNVAAQAAAARSAQNRGGRTLLYALALGLPGMVFFSVGAAAFAPKTRKRGFQRLTCILGIFVMVSLLVVLPGCGGGFKFHFTNAATFTLTGMAYVTDSSNNIIGVDVFTIPLTAD